jgi:hypothetical protein
MNYEFMRMPKLFTALLFALTLAGCIDETGLDECPGDVTLLFGYSMDGADLFDAGINSIDLFIFDADGLFVSLHHLNRADLDNFRGLHLSLPPGDYKVVGWANVADHSRFSEFIPGYSSMEACNVIISATTTGDPLYYAPYNPHPNSIHPGGQPDSGYGLTVPANASVTKEVEFARAYRRVNVYIEGFSGVATIEGRGLWAGYNFLCATQDLRLNLAQTAIQTNSPNGAMQTGSINFAYGEIPDDIMIVIRTPEGREAIAISLRQYLTDHPEADLDDIDILFTFMDVGVSVTVPWWESVVVIPR